MVPTAADSLTTVATGATRRASAAVGGSLVPQPRDRGCGEAGCQGLIAVPEVSCCLWKKEEIIEFRNSDNKSRAQSELYLSQVHCKKG